ncbi:MAG: ribosomal protein S18-alanine N-acetyltransferase, partial [candidate division KSB1 bacterium]|nr:ribosomal protein S18-alanine N-acetyltransferase [candidate division KSB1 bacterium]
MQAQPFTEWGAELRPMRPEDIDQVVAIEKRNFRNPWTHRAFRAEIEAVPVSQPLVVVYEDQIIGYVVPWFVADEMQIANIAIHENFRRRGLARQLIAHLCMLAQRRHCRVADLEVRRSNTAARQLYERMGFQVTSVRRNYYSPNEDALLMSKNLDLEQAAINE